MKRTAEFLQAPRKRPAGGKTHRTSAACAFSFRRYRPPGVGKPAAPSGAFGGDFAPRPGIDDRLRRQRCAGAGDEAVDPTGNRTVGNLPGSLLPGLSDGICNPLDRPRSLNPRYPGIKKRQMKPFAVFFCDGRIICPWQLSLHPTWLC